MSDQESALQNDFELIVGEAGGEIHNADIPVRWCVTPTMVKEMEDAGVADPHIVICATSESGYEQSRQVVPLTELMTYVRFTRSGEGVVHAWIIDASDGRKKTHNRFMQRDGNRYHTDLIDRYDGERVALKGEYKSTSFGLVIPDGVFGNKKVRPWLDWFVNLWHGGKVQDQCQYRRRMMIAFSLKAVPVLLWTTFLMVIRSFVPIFAYACGFSESFNKDYRKRFFQPYTFSVGYLMKNVDWDEQDFLFRRKTGSKKPNHWGDGMVDVEQTHFMLLPFIPIIPITFFIGLSAANEWNLGAGAIETGYVMIALFCIALFVDVVHGALLWASNTPFWAASKKVIVTNWTTTDKWLTENDYWNIVYTVLGFIGVAIAVVLLYLFPLIAGLAFGAAALGVFLLVFGERIYEFVSFGSNETDYTEIRELLCPKDMDNTVADYKKIPKKQRSLRLWYLDTKNKFCKPMQM